MTPTRWRHLNKHTCYALGSNIPFGGAVRASLAIRLANAATKYSGRCLGWERTVIKVWNCRCTCILKFSRGSIFTVFTDDWPIAKNQHVKINKLNCTARVSTSERIHKMIKIHYPWKLNPLKIPCFRVHVYQWHAWTYHTYIVRYYRLAYVESRKVSRRLKNLGMYLTWNNEGSRRQ